jgi:hypothetical protein
MRAYLTIIIALFSFCCFCQNSNEINKAIEIIEGISTYEEVFGTVDKTTTDITYFEKSGQITHSHIFNMDGVDELSVKMSFYLDDVIKSSMIYDFYKLSDDNYLLKIEVVTKNKSVEKTVVDMGKDNPIPISKTTHSNKIMFFISGRTVSEYLLKKYLDNIKILIGAEEYKRERFIKAKP